MFKKLFNQTKSMFIMKLYHLEAILWKNIDVYSKYYIFFFKSKLNANLFECVYSKVFKHKQVYLLTCFKIKSLISHGILNTIVYSIEILGIYFRRKTCLTCKLLLSKFIKL